MFKLKIGRNLAEKTSSISRKSRKLDAKYIAKSMTVYLNNKREINK